MNTKNQPTLHKSYLGEIYGKIQIIEGTPFRNEVQSRLKWSDRVWNHKINGRTEISAAEKTIISQIYLEFKEARKQTDNQTS